jgi:DNA helicase II / ATP-dependent DNA helicase PcrA
MYAKLAKLPIFLMQKPFWQSGLNSEQERAVKQTRGPVLILAGAGSGKTKTLTHRIAYLMAVEGVSGSNILAVTFTNKAAQEMKERVENLLVLGREEGVRVADMPQMGTFHTLCARILRKEIAVLGYETNFQIFDDQDQQSLIKQVMKKLDLDTDQIRPRALMEAISRAKNAFIDEELYVAQAGSYFEEIVGKVYQTYQQELKRNNALDFDDLIRFVVTIFQKNPEVLHRYQERFQYIMVDEYQDTNSPQYLFVHLLAQKQKNIFVIGDDYQSIYGWRQADIRNILNFEKDYPEAVVITLDQNYRSTQVILDAAQGVIVRNRDQRHKKLWTEQKEGSLVSLISASDEEAEARFVAETVVKAKENKIPYRNFAVLYRTNAQSRALEEMFLRLSVQYRIVGGIKFYQRKEIKDMVAYVRFLVNPKDFLALERIINTPKRGIGKVSLEKWKNVVEKTGQDFLQAIAILVEEGIIQKSKSKVLEDFARSFWKWQSLVKDGATTLPNLLDNIARESGYLDALSDGTSEGEDRVKNVTELFSLADKFKEAELSEALELLLEQVALSSDTDELNREADAVQVMTVHSAKGLEFPIVFIIGLEEGIFPHSRSTLSPQEMEEERRLMYVALTRAKEKIYLLHTDSRTIFGSTQINSRSRFIDEIPETLIVEEDFFHGGMLGAKKVFYPRKTTLSMTQKTAARFQQFETKNQEKESEAFESTEPQELRPGDMVEHPQFGSGLIISFEGSLLTIAFKRAGVKKMMAGVAPLKKI